MTNSELVERINGIVGYDVATEEYLNTFRENVNVDGKDYPVYLCGNDEMFDGNEFYQVGIDDSGNEYKFFYDTKDQNGNDIELDCIDHSRAYRMEPYA